MLAVRDLTCRVAAIDPLTRDIRRVRLEILEGGPLVFAAGQYASIRFPGQPARDYSIASLPGEPMLEFHIRSSATGTASRYVLERLRAGDTVRLRAPFGESYLREDHHGPILAVAGGSGLGPMRSIVETALARAPDRSVTLYFGVRDECDLYMEDRFRALMDRHAGFRFVPVLSEPSGPSSRRTGFVHEAVARDIPHLAGWKAYLAGPPPMVEATVAVLAARGLSAADIHADSFTAGPPAVPEHGDPPSHIQNR